MKNWKTTAEAILTSGPVVPVIAVKKLEHAVPMAKALVAGGVRVLEVTLRTECAPGGDPRDCQRSSGRDCRRGHGYQR